MSDANEYCLRRWTFEADDEGLLVCRGDHDKVAGCEKERLSPRESLEIIEKLRAEALSREVPAPFDVIAALEDWKHAEKRRWVKIEIDDCYGATCWRVELHRGDKTVYCSETDFISYKGIDNGWYEDDGNLYVSVVDGDTMDGWPGLAATVKFAIECAEKFWPK